MRLRSWSPLGVSLALLGGCCTSRAGRPTDPVPLESGSLQSGGRTRTFVFHLPAHAGAARRPLVIALHGRLGQGANQEQLSHLAEVGEREGFAVVFPDGVERSWADARGTTPASKQGVDDVAFIGAVIDLFVAAHGVDPARVYVTGMSNGAFMAQTLGCRLSARIAAIAAVAGTLPASLARACTLELPLPVLSILGTSDPLVPYAGGSVSKGAGGEVLSAEATARTWAALDGCQAEPVHSRNVAQSPVTEPVTPRSADLRGHRRGLIDDLLVAPDWVPDDGTTLERDTFGGCAGGAEVELLSVEGGGHTWPGGLQYLGEWAIGKTSRELDASEAIWRFFSAHHR